MAKVSIRELSRNMGTMMDRVARRRKPLLITRAGLPVAALIPIDADALDAWILASAPESIDGVHILRTQPGTTRRVLPRARAVTSTRRARSRRSR